MDDNANRIRFTPPPDNTPTREINGKDLNSGGIPPVEFSSLTTPITVEIHFEAENVNDAVAVFKTGFEFGDGASIDKVTFRLYDESGPNIDGGEEVCGFIVLYTSWARCLWCL